MAAKAALRPYHSAARSAWSAAILISPAPCSRQIVCTCSETSSTSTVGPVQLDQEHRPRAHRQPRVHGLLDRLDRDGVHHLDRGGHDPRGDDLRHHLAGIVCRGETGQHRHHPFGQRQQPDHCLGHDPESALGAHESRHQVERPVSLQRDHAAVGQHHLQLDHMVGGEAVFEAVRTAGVFGDVAADRAHLLAGRVGCVVETVPGDRAADLEVGDAGLHSRPPVGHVHIQDPVHPGQADDDALGDRHGTAGEAGAGTAGNERDGVSGAHPHHRGHLLGGAGQHHRLWDRPPAGQAVALVRPQLRRLGQHGILRKRRPQLGDQRHASSCVITICSRPPSR